MLGNWEELMPAYGRDYKTGKEAKADFLAGKDFRLAGIMHGNRLCSVRDFAPGAQAILRYNARTERTTVKVPK